MTKDINNSSRLYLGFQLFKYVIYALLCYNVYLFLLDDLSASAQTFSNGIRLEDIILAFSASIDTAAWVILLIIFELETFVLSDDKLKGSIKWLMLIAKVFCYSVIIYAAYGYIGKLLFYLNYSAYHIDDVCNLVGTSYTYLVTLDEYLPITQEVCKTLNNVPLLQLNGTEIISTQTAYNDAIKLAWVDIINSQDWLIIVIILELDVYLQLKGKYSGKIKTISQIIKPFLYAVLFGCAIYWWMHGDFVDFWDAFLWLLAFFFIEMNLFEWQAETEGQKQHVSH